MGSESSPILAQAASLDELGSQLSEYLGIDNVLPETVVVAAVVNPDYGRRLLAAREAPALLRHLISSPPAVGASASRFALRPRNGTSPTAHSSSKLILDASRSLWRWAVTAFSPVDDATYTRRVNACLECEHLTAPPSNLVYDLVKAVTPTSRVCGLCGCIATSKARMPHESCPAADQSNPALTRWGELRESTLT